MSIISTNLGDSLRYAWFSKQQEVMTGYLTYRRAGNGFPVHITCLSSTMDHGCNWDEMKFVGIVEGNPIGRSNTGRHPIMKTIDELIESLKEK